MSYQIANSIINLIEIIVNLSGSNGMLLKAKLKHIVDNKDKSDHDANI